MAEIKKKRLFIALELPSTIKVELASLAEPVPYIKWMNPHQFHITVHFLGDVEANLITKIMDCLDAAAKNLPAIPVKLSAIKVVKDRMIWVEVDDQKQLLGQLHQRLTQELRDKKIGEWGTERKYKPHILLGKYKGGEVLLGDDPVVVRAKSVFRVTPLELDTISLYESVLKPEGAEHRWIDSVRCGQAPPERWEPAGKGEA